MAFHCLVDSGSSANEVVSVQCTLYIVNIVKVVTGTGWRVDE